MAPYPTRVRVRSSASVNVPPGSGVDVIGCSCLSSNLFSFRFIFRNSVVAPGPDKLFNAFTCERLIAPLFTLGSDLVAPTSTIWITPQHPFVSQNCANEISRITNAVLDVVRGIRWRSLVGRKMAVRDLLDLNGNLVVVKIDEQVAHLRASRR